METYIFSDLEEVHFIKNKYMDTNCTSDRIKMLHMLILIAKSKTKIRIYIWSLQNSDIVLMIKYSIHLCKKNYLKNYEQMV